MSPPSGSYAELRARLGSQAIVGDAPIGAELVRRGVRWRKHGLLTDADTVRAVHAEYLAAGADFLRTNTFGLNPRLYLNVFKNREHMARIGAPGLDRIAFTLLRRAVEVADQAKADVGAANVPIAGVMSPLEHVFRPDLVPDEQAARVEHGEIAATLADSGVDFLLLEAMSTAREARAAVAAARATGLSFWVSLAVDHWGEPLGGEPIADLARIAADGGADAVLVTGAPLEGCALAFDRLSRSIDAPRGIAPMCGRFDPPSWKFEFHPRFAAAPSPATFAEDLARVAAAGADVVAAWCGASPEHVAALRAAFDSIPAGG